MQKEEVKEDEVRFSSKPKETKALEPPKEEAKERIKQELQIPFQTQGYTVNYDIEVWIVNDWA